MKKTILGACLFVSIVSCSHLSENQLVGKWQAAEALEEGKPLEVELPYINFEFRKDRTYTFHSTLNYEEKGRFYIDGGLLYTKDQLNPGSAEKAVEISLLTNDSLFLRMKSNEKSRILKLARVKN